MWHRDLEKSSFAILHAFRSKRFPTLFGARDGKLMAVREVACKLLGRALMVRAAAHHMDRSTFENYLCGVRHSVGIWLCIIRFDNLSITTLSHLAPALQSLQETFRAKTVGDENSLGTEEGEGIAEQSVSAIAIRGGGSFLCFTTSSRILEEIPPNMMETLRPISVISWDLTPSVDLIAKLLYSRNGYKERNAIAKFLFDSISFFAHVWGDKHFFGLHFLQRVLTTANILWSGSFSENHLRSSLLMHMEASMDGHSDISLAKTIIDGM